MVIYPCGDGLRLIHDSKRAPGITLILCKLVKQLPHFYTLNLGFERNFAPKRKSPVKHLLDIVSQQFTITLLVIAALSFKRKSHLNQEYVIPLFMNAKWIFLDIQFGRTSTVSNLNSGGTLDEFDFRPQCIYLTKQLVHWVSSVTKAFILHVKLYCKLLTS